MSDMPPEALAKAQDRKARIMEHAARLILQEGFERVTLDEIAASARVGKQAIYEFFENKDQLFSDVVRAEMSQLSLDAPSFRGNIRTALAEYAAMTCDAFFTPRSFGLQRANIVLTRRRPAIAAALHAQRRDAARYFQAYLDQEARNGCIADLGDEAFDVATRFGGMSTEGSRYFLGRDAPIASERKSQIDLCISIFLQGYLSAAKAPVEPAAAVATHTLAEPAPPMRLRKDRFDALWNAALTAFLEFGFDGVNIDSLIERSGVSRATIYRQFTNKEGLFRRVIGAEIDAIATGALAVLQSGDLETALSELALAALDAHLQKRSLDLHVLLIESAPFFPDLAQRFYDAQIERLSAPLIAAFQAAGAPPPSVAHIRIFHTLATFGLRFLSGAARVTRADRLVLSKQAARIMARGVALS
jgi:AcrR family transcriptional regulator